MNFLSKFFRSKCVVRFEIEDMDRHGRFIFLLLSKATCPHMKQAAHSLKLRIKCKLPLIARKLV